MRVIFDRSAFHGDRFDLLVHSPLRTMVERGQLAVYHTPIFIDETISEYGSPRSSGEWRKHLEFAVEICGGLFLPRQEICHDEIVVGKGPYARHCFPGRPTRRYRKSCSEYLDNLREVATTGNLIAEWQASAAEREDTNKKKNNQRESYGEIRQAIADAMRERAVRKSSFSEFLKGEFVFAGRRLMKHVNARRTEELADIWQRDPGRYPYYSAFVEGFVYASYYAASEHNLRLDRNAQSDYEQLAYLPWADVIVSDDERFMREAFKATWKPRGKRLHTAAEFVETLRSIFLVKV